MMTEKFNKSVEAYKEVARKFLENPINDIKSDEATANIRKFVHYMKGDMLSTFLSKRDSGNLKFLVLYHSDLDGSGSAYCANKIINYFLNTLNTGDTKIEIKFDRINYNYDLEACHIKKDLEACDFLFVVDYSLRPDNPHMKMIYDIMTSKIHYPHVRNIVWIDHHDSSIKEPTDPRLKEIRDNFLSASDTFIRANVKGLSATMLCCLVYVTMMVAVSEYSLIDNIEGIVNVIPELIGFISLYDTFHPEANPDFYYGINTINYDVQNKCTDWIDVSNVVSLFDEFNSNLYLANTDNNQSMLGKGATIREYVENSNRIYRTNTILLINIIFEGKQYRVAAINAKGNSFIFGDEYYKNNGVIMFYFNYYGTYTYSIFADDNNDNPNKVPCNKIAEKFGGGGHKGAAGFTLPINIFEHFMMKTIEDDGLPNYTKTLDLDKVIKEVEIMV